MVVGNLNNGIYQSQYFVGIELIWRFSFLAADFIFSFPFYEEGGGSNKDVSMKS